MPTECMAVGVISEGVRELAHLIRGMCFQYGTIKLHEVVLRVPLQLGHSATSVKLQRRLQQPDASNPLREPLPDRWTVVHEGTPVRGPAVSDLPAVMREVLEAGCYSSATPEFWQMLGGKFDYELVRSGNEYICMHEGHEIRVQIVDISTTGQPGNLKEAKRFSQRYMVEVTTRVAEGRHIEGARALGSFAEKLAPLVALQRPPDGVQA